MKKNLIPLNEKQRQLVESCLSNGRLTVVHQAIREYIVVNETIFGFGYEDLYQEGCIWLCKAAATFQEEKGVKFETYAFKVFPFMRMKRTDSSVWSSCSQRIILRISSRIWIPCSCYIR